MFDSVGDGKANGGAGTIVLEDKFATESTGEKESEAAGNKFRTLNPGERYSQQRVDARSTNVNRSHNVHMTQPAVFHENADAAVLSEESGREGGEGKTGSQGAGSGDGVVSDTTSEGSGYGSFVGVEALLEELSSVYAVLMRDCADTSDEGKKKCSSYINNLISMISDELELQNHNQVAELYSSAKAIDDWLTEKGEMLGGMESFGFFSLPSVKGGEGVNIPFNDYLQGLSRTGMMACLGSCLEHFDAYLNSSDIQCNDTVLQAGTMQNGSPELMLVSCLKDLKSKKISHVLFHLDGDSNNDYSKFLNKLDEDLKPLFQTVKEAGGRVPEKMFSEYISDATWEQSDLSGLGGDG